MVKYFNPYTDQSLFSFLWVFFQRFWKFITGNLQLQELVADEIQILVLCGVAISGALVGTFLVLRKMTMLANALSHTILLGIVVTYLLMFYLGYLHDPHGVMGIPLLLTASLITGIWTTFLTDSIHRYFKLQEDASIGLVFTSLFAIGILLVTLFTRNVHVGTELVMGNVDALRLADLSNVLFVLLLDFLFIFVFFKEFKLTTFDPGLSRALGVSPSFFNYLLMILTSATAVGAFRAVGVLMILAFFVFPSLIARFLTDRLSILLLLACVVGCIASILGVALSRHVLSLYHVGLSTGGIVVCLLTFFFIITVLLSPKKGVLFAYLQRVAIKKKINKNLASNQIEELTLEKNWTGIIETRNKS